MAMTAGSASVSDSGVVTKNGMAEAIYDQLIAMSTTVNLLLDPEVNRKKSLAALATAVATALVPYVTTNARAKIVADATGDALQQTPNPNNPDTNTKRPTADKFLVIV